ncbi:MAG TPA: F0F1 ATP synthase subunit A [Candidatus Aminicenantes bacterium]|nr:F0F1 ATP synthase subunit A [Candidatus Aminicenantes bacterium]
MEHNPWVAEFINRLIAWGLGLVGVHLKGPALPSHLVMAFLVTILLLVFFKLATRNLSLAPRPMQVFLESLYHFFQSLIDDMIGPAGRKFIPVVGTLGLFIVVCNLIGLLPEMGSPTSNINVTAGCAVFIFLYYHFQGIKQHGPWGYFKTFMGPAWWLAWLMVPIEIISHFSRPLSLSIRLFGNIFGEDLVILILASLVPFIAPLPMMAMAIFTSFVQAFVFVMLSVVYLSGATAEEH